MNITIDSKRFGYTFNSVLSDVLGVVDIQSKKEVIDWNSPAIIHMREQMKRIAPRYRVIFMEFLQAHNNEFWEQLALNIPTEELRSWEEVL